MSERLDILVVAPNVGSTFVETDVEGLGRRYKVERIAFRDYRGKPAYLRDLVRRLRTQSPKLLVLWFLAPAYALETMLIARLHGIEVAVVIGGLEIDYVPELGLGGLRWPHNRLRQRIGLHNADLVLVHTRFLAECAQRLARPRRLELVPLGVDVDRFTPDDRPKERLVVTTCFEITRETAQLKGLTTIVEVAALMPDVRFVVIGLDRDGTVAELRDRATPNIAFAGRVGEDELLELYRRAKVYVQASAHESFGVAVVESMACDCIPVLTDRAALPEVAGDAALYVSFGSVEQTVAAIRTALEMPEQAGRRSRARVLERFMVEDRFERLQTILGPLVERGGRP